MKQFPNPRRTVVVIGNGMVSQRFCERLLDYAPSTYRLVVFGEEPRPAYDRVKLTSFYQKQSADELLLEPLEWYTERGIELHLAERVIAIDTTQRKVRTDRGAEQAYDELVFATGSEAFVPRLSGIDLKGVFVYRTIEDLEAIREYAKCCRHATVMGGGLLGLEAAKAVLDLGLQTALIELASRLMPRQLDSTGGRLLKERIEGLGIEVRLDFATDRLEGDGEKLVGVLAKDGTSVDTDMLVISAGIRPRDELARQAGVGVGPRGGICVDDALSTDTPHVYAIGECALHRNQIYGLVAPGWDMADVLAKRLADDESACFGGADLSTKLKLLGVDVASFGDPFADERDGRSITYQDLIKGIYKKLVLDSAATRLIGGVLVGDASDYAVLTALLRAGGELPKDPETLLFGERSGSGAIELGDEAQVCSCNNVTRGDIVRAVADGADLGGVQTCTKAGSGCGGCMPLVTSLVNAELAKQGAAVNSHLCEHFPYSRQELYHIVRVKHITRFEELLRQYGKGTGCEVCKPTLASIFASVHNQMILEHAELQDTNDRFLANIQRQGLYSVVPRIPGGEVTPKALIRLGEIADKYGLYTKITGGQRIDLFGARVEQLPDIWQELVEAGFESGHAYGKALRTVKSCVGSTWCRFGVQDSVGFAIRVEQRYKGIRAPHKLKSAVSGCIRECAEAQSKDFGLIATEKGWNLYVCGNGGSRPRHADLLATDLDEEAAIRYIDRFLMYYIATADKLTRTARWLEQLEGGLEHLREVIIDDKLGICAELEAQMQQLVASYRCEWTETVRDPQKRALFRHFANAQGSDESVEWISQREQRRPADWGSSSRQPNPPRRRLPVLSTRWVKVGHVGDFPPNLGQTVRYGQTQIAVFHFAATGQWFACQNLCPHRRDMVLARGLLGDVAGLPKVACPMHKKAFSLETGEGLNDPNYRIQVFPVRVQGDEVLLELPDADTTAELIAQTCDGVCDESSATSNAAAE